MVTTKRKDTVMEEVSLACPVCSSRKVNICRRTGYYRCRDCGYSQEEEDEQNRLGLEAEADWIAEQEAKGREEEMEKLEEEQAYLAGGEGY